MSAPLIPPPDPASFWEFREGQDRVIGVGNNWYLSFKVTKTHDGWLEGIQTLADEKVHGALCLDRPVVIARDESNEPAVTLTLRRIENDRAFLQVTAKPGIPLAVRQ